MSMSKYRLDLYVYWGPKCDLDVQMYKRSWLSQNVIELRYFIVIPITIYYYNFLMKL